MPLLATLIGKLFTGAVGVFSLFTSYQLATKLAAYVVLNTLTVAFLASTFVCLHMLWSLAMSFFSGGGSMSSVSGAIAIGLGAIVPSGAGAVLSCCATVWIACQVYKLQKQGLIHFGK